MNRHVQVRAADNDPYTPEKKERVEATGKYEQCWQSSVISIEAFRTRRD